MLQYINNKKRKTGLNKFILTNTPDIDKKMSDGTLTGITDCFVQNYDYISQYHEQRICDNRQNAIGHFFLLKNPLEACMEIFDTKKYIQKCPMFISTIYFNIMNN